MDQSGIDNLPDTYTQDIAAASREGAIPQFKVPEHYVFDHEEAIVRPRAGLLGIGRRDGVWRLVASKKGGRSYWESAYRRFAQGKDAAGIFAAAAEMRTGLDTRTGSSHILLDLLKPQVEMPGTGPTGNPLLDLTGGRPDTPQSIAFNLIADQANPHYQEYVTWVRRNARAFDKAWIGAILTELGRAGASAEIRKQCAALADYVGRLVVPSNPAHVARLRITAEETTAILSTEGGRERYAVEQRNFMAMGMPPSHQRGWYGLLDSGAPDIGGGVFDNLVIDVSLKRVRAKSASFRNCIFLRAFFEEAILDDADFTNCFFDTGLSIPRASVARANFTNAYVGAQLYCAGTRGLHEANFTGLRLADGRGWTEFLACLADQQKKDIRTVPWYSASWELPRLLKEIRERAKTEE